jgi:hypothetical protein
MRVVSVVIPTRDRPVQLRRAALSALAQTLQDIEVIVVDDGSAIAVEASEVADGDPRVRVIRHDRSRGVSAARNAACEAATGEWIAFLDDDDFWAPGKLALQVERGVAEGAGFVFTGALMVTPEGGLVLDCPAPPSDDLTRRLLAHNSIGGPSTVLARADAVRAAGPFDEELSVTADWDMWVRLSQVTRACSVSEPLAAIVVHEGSMQLTHVDQIRAELKLLRTKHAQVAAELGTPFGSGAAKLWLAEKTWKASGAPHHTLRYALTILRHPRAAGLGPRLRRYARRAPQRPPAWTLEQLAVTSS